MNRSERRVNQRAQETLTKLGDKFLDFFTTAEEPMGPETEALVVKLSAQWKNYCALKKFKPEAYEMLDKYIAQVVGQYLAIVKQESVAKEETPSPEKP
jgi:hypothetical protein